MLRILEQLKKRENVKRTPLAMYANLSYDALMKYLNFMIDMELVSITEGDEIFVNITAQGDTVRIALSPKINKIE